MVTLYNPTTFTSSLFFHIAMNDQQPADIPTLTSLFSEEWPDDVLEDANYLLN
jgi:hypothetical protein